MPEDDTTAGIAIHDAPVSVYCIMRSGILRSKLDEILPVDAECCPIEFEAEAAECQDLQKSDSVPVACTAAFVQRFRFTGARSVMMDLMRSSFPLRDLECASENVALVDFRIVLSVEFRAVM